MPAENGFSVLDHERLAKLASGFCTVFGNVNPLACFLQHKSGLDPNRVQDAR